MEYTTDWILKSPIEDIQDYLKNATIIDLIAVIENVKKRTDLDLLSLSRVKDIEAKIASETEVLDNLNMQKDFAVLTLASTSEIDYLAEKFAKSNGKVDGFSIDRERIKQTFDDKKQAVLTLAYKMIGDAPISKLEDYRNHLIGYLKDRIASIETNKENREITTDTLLKDRDFTKEDLTVKAITREIKEMENAVLSKSLILNDEVISKIKSLRLKKDSLEHETFTYICTEKLKTSLKGISNDITKLQMELYKIMHLDTNELRNLILNDYTETKEEIKLANYTRIYRSYLENIVKVPLDLKKVYRRCLDSYSTSLSSLKNPSLDEVPLSDIESLLKDNYTYMKTLESYKSREINRSVEEKYLYTTARNNGLFELPFSKDKWLAYFGKYFEPLLNSLDKIIQKNNKYIALNNVSLKSKDVIKEIGDYEEDLKYLLNELYKKVLSIYLKVNCFINVSIYDYRDTESLNRYIMAESDNINKEIDSVNGKIVVLNGKKKQILTRINAVYTTIDTEIKATLNSILNGTYKEMTVETPTISREEPHHFFDEMTSLESDFGRSEGYQETSEEPVDTYLTNEPNEFTNYSIANEVDGKEETGVLERENTNNDVISFDDNSLESKETNQEEVSEKSSEVFNPDDIFGVKEEPAKPVEGSISSDVISFDDEEENGITRADKKAFADLLGPTKSETPNYLKSAKETFNTLDAPQPSMVLEKDTSEIKNQEIKPVRRGVKVIKIESVVSKAVNATPKASVAVEAPKTDALEIKERIENNDLRKKKETIFNPASASEVVGEYNDSNAPIDLNAFLNGSLSENSSLSAKASKEQDKKLTLSPNDNLDLMNFLNQIENNDSKAA